MTGLVGMGWVIPKGAPIGHVAGRYTCGCMAVVASYEARTLTAHGQTRTFDVPILSLVRCKRRVFCVLTRLGELVKKEHEKRERNKTNPQAE